MATSLDDGSAKIYQFPRGGRAALDDRRHERIKPPVEQNVPRVSETICSGSWYHEEAIQEEKPGWER
jgi:hypothetical protein